MPFIGKTPETGAYQLIDSITTSATATYALTVDGSAYFPASARNLIVSLNGVTQAPESAYTVSGSDIVFASALTASDVIDYILVIGDAVDIGTPSDGTVGTSQMSYPLGNFSSTGIDDNATSTAITIDSSQNVNLSNDLTVDTDTLVVDSTNNAVGINTVTASGPQSTFHIEQNGDDADGGFRLSRDNALASYTQYINGSSIWNLAYGNPSSDDSPTNIISVTTAGNVGIGGATSLSSALTVGDDDSTDSGATKEIRLGYRSDSARSAVIEKERNYASNQAPLHIRSSTGGSNSPIIFHTDSSGENARIDINGNLLVGQTASGASRVEIKGASNTSTGYSLFCRNSDSTLSFYVRNDGIINVGQDGNSPYNYSVSGRDLYVDSAGTVGYLSSTRESKANIESLSDISWLYNLSPVSFNYREKDEETSSYTDQVVQETEYGFIADEVEQVHPNLCFYDLDEEGNQTLAGVTYRKLIPVLTKAIQEQQAMIETLQAQVAELQGAN